MRIQDIMTTGVETIEPTATAETARERMKQARIHHLVVADGAQVVGVISARDLGGPRSRVALNGQSVSEMMADSVVHIEPDSSLREAANLMRGRSIGCLPVMKRGKLVGILTVTDILDVLGRGLFTPISTSQRPPLRRRVSRNSGKSIKKIPAGAR